MAPGLQPRDIDLSSESLRRAFTPHPQEQRLTLYILAGSVLVAGVIYALSIAIRRLRDLQVLIYPIMLLNTTVHELGHSLGALLMCSWPVMTVHLDTSGITYWKGQRNGLRSFVLVTPSGYLASGVYAAAMVFAGFSILGVGFSWIVRMI